MKLLVTGSSGLVGSALASDATDAGDEVWRIGRQADGATREITWNPARGELDVSALDGFDAVIHLAGENIADGRWTAAKKQRIRDSRVEGTRMIADALAGLKQGPRVLICASAIGIYGSRGDEWLDERSAPGTGFLAGVAREWEAAADPARHAGIRTVHLRFGVVLTPRGGALAKMLPAFRAGLGGPVGNGGQFVSWISIADVCGIVRHVIGDESLTGPVNAVAPNPVTNREFATVLGRVLHRPARVPAPAFALRLAFGEMADATLLASARVKPAKLIDAGFMFQHPDLEPALRELLADV